MENSDPRTFLARRLNDWFNNLTRDRASQSRVNTNLTNVSNLNTAESSTPPVLETNGSSSSSSSSNESSSEKQSPTSEPANNIASNRELLVDEQSDSDEDQEKPAVGQLSNRRQEAMDNQKKYVLIEL
jgi:hypothetical protein